MGKFNIHKFFTLFVGDINSYSEAAKSEESIMLLSGTSSRK